MGMLPGMAKMKDQIASANLDDKVVKRQRAIILSMTPRERRNPDILKASRKKRIAAGSGTKVEEVNRLLKQHRQMADIMKELGRAKRGPLSQMASAWKRPLPCRSRRSRAACQKFQTCPRAFSAKHRNCQAACPGLAAANCRASAAAYSAHLERRRSDRSVFSCWREKDARSNNRMLSKKGNQCL
jgi:hypothetical protein